MIRTLSTLLLATAVLAPAARSQVAVDQGALDRLKPSAPAPTAGKPKPQPAKPKAAAPAKPSATKPASPKPAQPKPISPTPGPPRSPVVLAPAPPPPVILPPAAPPPPHPVPEIEIPLSPDAKGAASKILGGLRVTFGPGAAELNPSTVAALRATARTIAADPAATFNVYAYADGTADDPSTPRRLSLSRGLAARAVLMSEGIASTRIYVRALGATAADGPADRVDVTQVGIGPAPP